MSICILAPLYSARQADIVSLASPRLPTPTSRLSSLKSGVVNIACEMSGASLVSRLDNLYRRLLLTGFFTKGWGDPEHMRQIFALRRRLVDRQQALAMVKPHEVKVTVESEKVEGSRGGIRRTYATFESPCVGLLDDDLLPVESRRAHVELVEPVDEDRFGSGGRLRPVCVQFAGTGDHYFWRRRNLSALPMLEEKGIASLIVENPFYGLRKPKEQVRP